MQAFSALSDPIRFQIVEILAHEGRLPATQIARHFSISPPAISQHLKILRQANLVSVEKKAQQRLYAIDPAGIAAVEQKLCGLRKIWAQRFDALDALLQRKMNKNNREKDDKHEQK